MFRSKGLKRAPLSAALLASMLFAQLFFFQHELEHLSEIPSETEEICELCLAISSLDAEVNAIPPDGAATAPIIVCRFIDRKPLKKRHPARFARGPPEYAALT